MPLRSICASLLCRCRRFLPHSSKLCAAVRTFAVFPLCSSDIRLFLIVSKSLIHDRATVVYIRLVVVARGLKQSTPYNTLKLPARLCDLPATSTAFTATATATSTSLRPRFTFHLRLRSLPRVLRPSLRLREPLQRFLVPCGRSASLSKRNTRLRLRVRALLC